ncbi:hypothetical protein BIZ83_gp032 [Erwinia phage vB_EamM_ChrisDB]|uniref:hypothetical protein n=1 Tax=Erwinia phage vB_EamM_ChrisDB TaxID=1883371 RepID=UPI00081CE1A5|nr:hypothetical protein BIZ83_gp032 [Erwinia phage vB_EamM_ChrisDB]ANZ48821.1 hypothetical protein CHRISDB_259 [Erwinia phage vB_EamM_ChrisDB]
MFTVEIEQAGFLACTHAIKVNGAHVADVDERTANLWRVIADADQVFVSDDMSLTTEREPLVLVRFRLEQKEMTAFLNAVMFDYDAHTEGPLHMGWDEIDPSLRSMFRLKAENLFESDVWELDIGNHYPRHVPIIIVHPEKVGGNDMTPFIELYYAILDSETPA